MSMADLSMPGAQTAPSRKTKTKAKSAKKSPRKSKTTARSVAAVKPNPVIRQRAGCWIASFVYANAAGAAAVAIRRIRARDEEQARELALKAPPGEEFMLSIIPESDEQFLGQVRLKAQAAAKKKV